jgi:hypothetical protein
VWWSTTWNAVYFASHLGCEGGRVFPVYQNVTDARRRLGLPGYAVVLSVFVRAMALMNAVVPFMEDP